MNDLITKKIAAQGIRFSYTDGETEVARAFLYILHNDLHHEPFGLMEDVFVLETHRGKGVGSTLVTAIIREAQNQGCYKLICTSRHTKPEVHALYTKLGFREHGKEFRLNFESKKA